ncbi:MAG: hypothetical protein V5A84_01095, partial [Planctomycetota bacterium]
YEGMDTLIREYYTCLQEGREPPVPADEAIELMEMMDRTWEAVGEEAIHWPEEPEAGEEERISERAPAEEAT